MSEAADQTKSTLVPRHFANLPADRRDAIIAVASAEFVAHGFERASMNRIIVNANVSKGSMYHFFESKADLFALAVGTVIERVETHVGPLPAGCADVSEFRDAFKGWYRALLAHLAEHRDDDALLEILRAAMATPNPPEPVQRCAMRIAAWYAVLFDELASLGALRSDIPPNILAGAVERATLAIDRWFIDEIRLQPGQLDQMADIGADIFMRLITP
ncbi:MAG: TetR/AcrR family transcriptional regulator [Stackebrandtia sp.]